MLFNEAQRILCKVAYMLLCMREGIRVSMALRDEGRKKRKKGAKKMDLVFTYRMMFGVRVTFKTKAKRKSNFVVLMCAYSFS